MKPRAFACYLALTTGSFGAAVPTHSPSPLETEICVYGGIAGGVIAAVQPHRMGRSVILVSPEARLGGLSSGGLGQTDIGNKRAIGGLAHEFYERVARHYARPEAWNHQALGTYKSVGQSAADPGEPAMRTFEPHVAAGIFEDFVRENQLAVLRGERLDLARAVEESGARITAIRLESGRIIRARVFIEATYEGDPANRIPFTAPARYDARHYDLLLRNFETGLKILLLHNAGMPNLKTNNNTGFSTDFIGENYAYPEADFATRDRIRAARFACVQGLLSTPASRPRVPEKIRTEAAAQGVTRDEFTETDGWPSQLYVREARRMTGEVVMTEHHCMGRTVAPDPVGLGAYNMDSHNTRRDVNAAGHVVNEGDVQVKVPSPYPVAYGAIIPRAAECENLLVPVALSATHIAYGSIRMEPVFMVLGQSAATAAVLAIEQRSSVQAIDRVKVHAQLLADRLVLSWLPRP